jgi:hypothetical protein
MKLPRLTIEEWRSRIVGSSCRIVCKLDDEKVVKFGCPSDKWTGLQNRIEHDTWQSIKDTGAAPFFAATLYGAPNGSYNVQEMAGGNASYDEGDKIESTPEFIETRDRLNLSDGGTHQMGIHYATGKPVVRDYGATNELWNAEGEEKCGRCRFCKLQRAQNDYGW